jgi:hypothetical protein
MFRNKDRFYDEELSAPPRTPKLEDYIFSAVRYCLFSIFASSFHIGGRSSIRNLRTCHAEVTGSVRHTSAFTQLDLDSAFLCKLLSAQDHTSVFWSANIKVFYVDVYIQFKHNFYVEFKLNNILQKVHYYVILNALNCVVCSTSTSLVAIDRVMCKSLWLLDRRDVT